MNLLKSRNTYTDLKLTKAIVTFAFLLLVCSSLIAQDQDISQMLHTAWLGRDGAPQDINALAQTPDGVLWIGSTGGLFSFDGIAFHTFQTEPGNGLLPFSAISSLLVSKRGDLWVEGIYDASVVRISNGRITVFDRFVGSACCVLSDLQEDSDGNMWAILNADELVRLDSDDTWHRSPNPTPSVGIISSLFFDSLGTQWVIQDKLLYKRLRGQTQFIATGHEAALNARLTEDRDHGIWIFGRHHETDPQMKGAKRLIGAEGSGKQHYLASLRRFTINDMIEAPDAHVWLAIRGKGVARLALSPSGQNKPRASNSSLTFYSGSKELSSNDPTVLYRDSAGNIWVGGARGLERFSPAHLISAIGEAEVGAWSVCTNPKGEVWLASDKGDLWVITDNQRRHIYRAQAIYKLYCGRAGDVWFIDKMGIMNAYRGHFTRLPLLPENVLELGQYSRFVALSELADHELLTSEELSSHDSVWLLRGGRWKRFLPNGGPGTVTSIVKQGNALFFGDISGKVTRVEGSVVNTYVTRPTGIGVIANLATTSNSVFALGDRGIAVFRDSYFQMLTFMQPGLAYTVSGLVEENNGDYWINGSHGVVHIASSEMRLALEDPTHKIIAAEFHEGDFIGPATWWKPNPSATLDIKGTLWFSTLNGVVSLDPESLKRPANLPQLSIRSIAADGQNVMQNSVMSAQSHALSIRYFAINLSDPEKVIYRYRLDGFENSWQEVGHRIEAIYTNLKPGAYTFRVMASNGDGRWTSPVSSSPFRVMPHFYQAWWFDVFCVVVVICLLWSLLTLRLRAVAKSIRIRAEERGEERIRIAGEIHDTLLQGVQGLILNFHVAAQKLAADDESRKILDRTLTMAEQITVEGRNRLTDLRSHNMSDSELFEALQRVCADLEVGTGIHCQVVRTGASATLRPQLVDEIFNIGREALTNAFRHSGASNIELDLVFDKGFFTLVCRDDGCGFDATATRDSPERGHWGLRGIEERTKRISGLFKCESERNKGTTLTIQVPHQSAYVRQPGILSLFSRLS